MIESNSKFHMAGQVADSCRGVLHKNIKRSHNINMQKIKVVMVHLKEVSQKDLLLEIKSMIIWTWVVDQINECLQNMITIIWWHNNSSSIMKKKLCNNRILHHKEQDGETIKHLSYSVQRQQLSNMGIAQSTEMASLRLRNRKNKELGSNSGMRIFCVQ